MIHFGTGPIRGFGTTLLAGLIIHMFTALFVTKAIFGLWIKKGWMKTIHFIDLFKEIHYPWIAKARPWQIASLGLSLMAVVLFVATGDSQVRPRLHGRHRRAHEARRADDHVDVEPHDRRTSRRRRQAEVRAAEDHPAHERRRAPRATSPPSSTSSCASVHRDRPTRR